MAGLRVAMLGWEFPPFASGGLGTHCYELTKALAKRGVEIDFFMPKTSYQVSAPWLNIYPADWSFLGKLGPAVLPASFGAYSGFQGAALSRTQIERLSKRAGESKTYDLGFFEAVSAYNYLAGLMVEKLHLAKPYGLVHCHDWIPARAAIAIKRKTGLPLVTTIHSTEYDRTADLWPFDWILKIERDAVRESDQVIAVSKRSARQLVDRLGSDPRKTNTVYNAIDWGRFPKHRERLQEAGRESKVVLYHGRLSVQKGVEFFLRAAAKVLSKNRDVRFLVSGKGDLLPRLVELSLDLGISDKVSFLGYVSEEQLSRIFCASDVLVLPSVSEPFGIVALEAMASGTPVIVSKTSGVSELVKNCLTVDFWDVDEMASKMLATLYYGELNEEMRQNAMSETEGLTWDAVARDTISVYNKARHGQAARPAVLSG